MGLVTIHKHSQRPAIRRRRRMAELAPPGALFSAAPPSRLANIRSALLAAALGVAAGFAGAAISGAPAIASASGSGSYAARLDLRDAPLTSVAASDRRRSKLIEEILTAGEPERFPAVGGAYGGGSAAPPRLVIIFDDMGLDPGALDAAMALPGPVTFSFLPYAKDVQRQVDAAKARGDAVLLHLPMQPSGAADPGPGALDVAMDAATLFDTLAENLDAFEGYIGVNNHMGSKFTRDEQAMKRVLSMIDQRGLVFVDSLTTGASAAARAGAAVGAEVFVRDVFLDAEPGREGVRRQLALAEKIAAKTGYAIVICHPRRETLEVIGPWLTTALARGFDLATIADLRPAPAPISAAR